jgi:hypothetical protein
MGSIGGRGALRRSTIPLLTQWRACEEEDEGRQKGGARSFPLLLRRPFAAQTHDSEPPGFASFRSHRHQRLTDPGAQ